MEKEIKLVIESLLFAAEKPLLLRDIQGVLPDRELPEIVETLKTLRQEYEAMDRSFSLKEVAQGYQIRTKPDYAPYVLRMTKRSAARLSPAAMETLAIIAYKQPVIRHEIEQFRGVDTGGILRTLLEKNLIRILGRKHLPGRPLIYGTTRRFLEVFDLNNLESLPKLKEIKEFGIGETQATQTQEDNPRQHQPYRKKRPKQTSKLRNPRPERETTSAPLSHPGKPFNPEEPWRLNRILSSAGLTSRRKADEWIQSGKITVNGKPVKKLGTTAFWGQDDIRVDGKKIPFPHRNII